MEISLLSSFPSSIEYIKADYEYFILKNYKLDHAGLFHDNNKIYAVVRIHQDSDMTLNEIIKLYDSEFKTMGIPSPLFVEKEGKSFIKIDLRNIYERINLFGQGTNILEFNNKINMALPTEFHPFHVRLNWSKNTLKFTFKNEISESEFQDVILICEGLGYYGYIYENHTDNNLPDYSSNNDSPRKKTGSLTLISSKYLKNKLPRSIIEKYEEDQEFWSQNKFSIFSDISMTREDCLTDSFKKILNGCFIDATVFRRNNIREYLSLYDTIIIAIPLSDTPRNNDFYETFKLNKIELLELVRRGRVKFVAYQNLHRYNMEFIADLLATDPECILFSRRLASASLLEIRKKTGIFGYSFDTDMQYLLQKTFWQSEINALKILAASLSQNASSLEYSLDKSGAVELSQFGAGIFAGNIYKDYGKDYSLELVSSAMGFEFAQGLNTHHFPFDSESYSEVNACNIINGIYNGVEKINSKLKESKVEQLLSDVLTISNDMNVLELDDIMNQHGRKKIPEILSKYSELSDEERKYEIYNLNKDIKRIESRDRWVSYMDISGLVPTATGAIMEYNDIQGGAYVALLPWVIKLMGYSLRNLPAHEIEIMNKLSYLTRGNSYNTLLIKKIRKDIK